MSVLQRLLHARRRDLVDGYPALAVIAALQKADPLASLNYKLAPFDITVVLSDKLVVAAHFNPHLLKYGILLAATEGENISVTVASAFLYDRSSIIIKALIFQSVCVHQLVHRMFNHECKIFTNSIEDALNDDDELKAIGAGIAHDLQVKGYISTTGAEQLQELSPRLANILDNSSAFSSGSIIRLQVHIKNFT